MALLQVSYNRTSKVALIQPNGAAVPSGSVNVGTFNHPETDPLGPNVNHVLFHHVRDLLYKRSEANAAQPALFPFNITDMDSVTITMDPSLVPTPVGSIAVTPETASVVVGATRQLAVAFTPSNATDKGVTYVSSDPTKATVNASGLVTGVAVGSATITVTSNVNQRQDKSVITVTAT